MKAALAGHNKVNSADARMIGGASLLSASAVSIRAARLKHLEA